MFSELVLACEGKFPFSGLLNPADGAVAKVDTWQPLTIWEQADSCNKYGAFVAETGPLMATVSGQFGADSKNGHRNV